MADISNNTVWSEVDDDNNTSAPGGFPTGMDPSRLDDSCRALMGAIKRAYDHANATLTRSGRANAYVLTYAATPSGLVKGDNFSFVANFTNSDAATVNINGLGAKAIIHPGGSALVAGDIVNNGIALLSYDGTRFHLLNPQAVFIKNGNVSIRGTLAVAGTTTLSGVLTGVDSMQFGGSDGTKFAISAISGTGLALNVPTGKNLTLGVNGSSLITMTRNGGLVMGSATGARQGVGTVNATGLFVNGNAVITSISPATLTFASDVTGSGTSSIDLTVVATHLSSPLPLAQGGTANTTGLPSGTISSGDLTGTYPSPTLKTVNSNVGSFTAASITVNAKGLVTAASSGTVTGRLTAGTTATVNPVGDGVAATAHGLGAAPNMVEWWLENTSADLGYSTGDRAQPLIEAGGVGAAITIIADATNITIAIGSTVIDVNRKDTAANAAITASKWKVVAVPYKVS